MFGVFFYRSIDIFYRLLFLFHLVVEFCHIVSPLSNITSTKLKSEDVTMIHKWLIIADIAY